MMQIAESPWLFLAHFDWTGGQGKFFNFYGTDTSRLVHWYCPKSDQRSDSCNRSK